MTWQGPECILEGLPYPLAHFFRFAVHTGHFMTWAALPRKGFGGRGVACCFATASVFVSGWYRMALSAKSRNAALQMRGDGPVSILGVDGKPDE